MSAAVLRALPGLYPGDAHPVPLLQRYQACKLLRLLGLPRLELALEAGGAGAGAGGRALPVSVPVSVSAEALLVQAVHAARTLHGDGGSRGCDGDGGGSEGSSEGGTAHLVGVEDVAALLAEMAL